MIAGDDKVALGRAMKLAMNMLSRRELCSSELRAKLQARSFSEEVVGTTLQRLQDDGLQSDKRCAAVLLREHIRRGHGPVRIHIDLEQRGLSPDLIVAAMADEDCDFAALACEVLQKRYGCNAPANYKEKGKRIAFLYRRGFAMDDCRAAAGDQG